MARYLLKRIVYFIFTLFLISLVSFAVTVCAPGDPVDRLLSSAVAGQEMSSQAAAVETQRVQLRHQLGLDLPLFYISLQSAAEPDTLHRIFPLADRNTLKALTKRCGNWEKVSDYYLGILNFQRTLALHYIRNASGEASRKQKLNDLAVLGMGLRSTPDEAVAGRSLRQITEWINTDSSLQFLSAQVAGMQRAFAGMTKEPLSMNYYCPALRFHGENQYHRWLFGSSGSGKGVLRGDFGLSYISRQPVGSYILDRLPWTVCLAFISVLLAYAISIPLAARMAKKPGGSLDHRVSAFLYLLYSMPGFWLATLLLMVFANPEVLPVFPASGVKPVAGYPPDASFFQNAWISLPYLVLPTVCYSYAFIAVLTRLLRVSLQQVSGQDYIRTARAKGLDEKTVRLKHALPNALLPAVTLFAEVFPLAIGGSVIIESIFTIPGMGSGIYQSIQSQDYPVLVCVFTLTGLMTMVGYLLTDITYAFLDPRIRYS